MREQEVSSASDQDVILQEHHAPKSPGALTETSNQWLVAAASVQGTSHQKLGQPCQDSHNWGILPHNIAIAAVADGAGSAKYAETGAKIAARCAVDIASSLKGPLWLDREDEFWRSLLFEILTGAQSSVEKAAIDQNARADELATTLILVIATPSLVASAQIGDGASVVADAENHITMLTLPQTGEYANTTTFITSPNALEKAQLTVWRGSTAKIAIFSDGLQMLALEFPQRVPFVPFFQPLFDFIAKIEDEQIAREQLRAFLNSPKVKERTDDDLTLLLASFH